MTWNYRIVKYLDGSGYGLHEVHYDKRGEPWGMTDEPCCFVSDTEEGAAGIWAALATARNDAQQRGVLEEPEVWPGKGL
jgi:hypothetical protein